MYGKTIKYVIPELTPSAIFPFPVSTTALHIAHCALVFTAVKIINTNKMDIVFFILSIKRSNHNINNNTRNGNIQP